MESKYAIYSYFSSISLPFSLFVRSFVLQSVTLDERPISPQRPISPPTTHFTSTTYFSRRARFTPTTRLTPSTHFTLMTYFIPTTLFTLNVPLHLHRPFHPKNIILPLPQDVFLHNVILCPNDPFHKKRDLFVVMPPFILWNKVCPGFACDVSWLVELFRGYCFELYQEYT